jgi:hypothetical protein
MALQRKKESLFQSYVCSYLIVADFSFKAYVFAQAVIFVLRDTAR